MFKVEIKSPEVATSQGHFDDGRAWTSRKQTGYVHIPGKHYPVEIGIKLQDRPAYAPGFYSISPESFYIRNGQLQLGKLMLEPVASSKSAAA